jgi:OOP family OmpA-OmpF porin
MSILNKLASSKRSRLLTYSVGLALLISAPAFSQSELSEDDSFFYCGPALGKSWADVDQLQASRTVLTDSWHVSHDEQSFALRFFAGYQFNRFIALEGGYFNLGKFDYE